MCDVSGCSVNAHSLGLVVDRGASASGEAPEVTVARGAGGGWEGLGQNDDSKWLTRQLCACVFTGVVASS